MIREIFTETLTGDKMEFTLVVFYRGEFNKDFVSNISYDLVSPLTGKRSGDEDKRRIRCDAVSALRERASVYFFGDKTKYFYELKNNQTKIEWKMDSLPFG